MVTHKEIMLKCICGKEIAFTEIVYDDFDCGMMGMLYCPKCKEILLPSHHRKAHISETKKIIDGEDKGWKW